MAAAAKKTKPTTSRRRRALLGKVHIAKKQLGLTDEEYRGIIAQQYKGKTSAKDLSDRRLVELVEYFKTIGFSAPAKKKSTKGPARAGSRPLADGKVPAKIRALWLDLYHLGVVRDPAEAAMAAFVKRMSGADAIQWLDPDSAVKVIEALKDWATREAGVNWSPRKPGEIVNPKLRVIDAQIRILAGHPSLKVIDLTDCTKDDADRIIEELGQRIRKISPNSNKGTG